MIDIVKRFKRICEEKGYEELTHPVVCEDFDFETHYAGWSDKEHSRPLYFYYTGIQPTFTSLINRDYFSFVMILLRAFNYEFNFFGAYPYINGYIESRGYDCEDFKVWPPNVKHYFPSSCKDINMWEEIISLDCELKRYSRYLDTSTPVKFPCARYLSLAADFLHNNFVKYPPKIVKI